MPSALFRGIGVALVTVFDETGDVDAKATASLAAELVSRGVTAVVVAGSTGEAAALDAVERATLVEAVKAALPSDVPVLAGVGAPSTRQALRNVEAALEAGADGLLALSPPGSGDLDGYYGALRAAASVPLLAYHYPAVSAPGVPVDALSRLGVDGVKDSSGDPDRLLETRVTFSGACYTGAASLLALAGPIGYEGAILALANVLPEECARAFNGDAEAQLQLVEANRAAKASFPHGVKQLCAERFGIATYHRLG